MKEEKGSMTVEATLVLPLFLFFMLGFLYLIELIGLMYTVQMSLSDTANQLSVAGYYSSSTQNIAVIQADFATNLGSNYMGKSCIYGGAISLLESNYEKEDLNLIARYVIRIPLPIWNIRWLSVKQTVRTRLFVGRDKTQGDSTTDNETTIHYVYITDTGTVYHESSECSHLKRVIKTVSYESLKQLRNEAGGCYYPCELCHNAQTQDSGTCYITSDGNRYHSKTGCSGLKRTVRKVDINQVRNWRKCSRCG